MKIYLLVWLILSFTTYIAVIVKKYGVLKSISDSYYVMKYKHVFTFFIWNIGLSFIFLGETGWMFGAGGFLCFVGTAPMFKEEFEGKVHSIGAIGGIALGFVSLLINFHQIYPLVFMVAGIGLMKIFKIKNQTWWIEILAFVIMIVGLSINILHN